MSIQIRDAAFIELQATGRLFIEEQRGGGYNIHMADQILEDVWLGVPTKGGMHFIYWKDAMRILAESISKVAGA